MCRPTADDLLIVKQIWTGNAYRNFNYLIACSETGEALAIDPLDHEKCMRGAREEGWILTQFLNAHEHHDHTCGNAAISVFATPNWRSEMGRIADMLQICQKRSD
jgi:glyoxylase-like metal-dependent hydrolase (beta-lactamase superfamily II)